MVDDEQSPLTPEGAMTATAPAAAGGSTAVPRPEPPPGSAAERQRFAELQQRLPAIFERLFPDPLAPQTIVVVPSMSLDEDELSKLAGACHYEERLLCLLMLLRRPGIRIVYVTSRQLAPATVEYFLQLLPGVPLSHAQRRLTLLDCHDASSVPLTRKILDRPRLLERIRACIPDLSAAHMTCFNATALERTLAVRLDIPLYGCDPDLLHHGSKSGSRIIFRRAGVPMPDGFESLRDMNDVAHALHALKRHDPTLRRAVVKLNEGFSGEGNALFSFEGAPRAASLRRWITAQLPRALRFTAPGESCERFGGKFARMGGVVESFVEGAEPRSPSVQCRIDPLGSGRVVSTHDQLLDDATGQVFLGCTFPADAAYARDLHELGTSVTAVLRQEGVLGRFGIDFISHRRNGRWEHAALEINLRKGGTTHPYLMLQFLTDGQYDCGTGEYRTASGQPRCYQASDNLGGPAYRGLTPDDLIDIAVRNGLYFYGAAQRGVMFHLIGALSEHGKLGAICIAEDRAAAARLYQETVSVLDRETGAAAAPHATLADAPRRARRNGAGTPAPAPV
jgi:hypothetical protein